MIIEDQNRLFNLLWKISDKESMLSGLPLSYRYNPGDKGWYSLFAHLLSKARGKFPHFKLYIGNVWLMTEYEHHLLDHGDSDKRRDYTLKLNKDHNGKYMADWHTLFNNIEKLKKLYYETFPEKVNGIIMKYSKDEVKEKIDILNKEYLEMQFI